MVFQDKLHDTDSTSDVWDKLYNVIYPNTFDDIFDFSERSDIETSKNCKRLYIKIDKNKQPELANTYPKFKMAGNCIFNFNDKKVTMYKKLINPQNEELLTECQARHHRLVNFSFMPITGGLNNKKGTMLCISGLENKSFDRPDVLIAELASYYNGKETRILENII